MQTFKFGITPEQTLNDVIDMYYERGYSPLKIAVECNLRENTIRTIIWRYKSLSIENSNRLRKQH